MPSANSPTTVATGIRRPRIQGTPPIREAAIVMREGVSHQALAQGVARDQHTISAACGRIAHMTATQVGAFG